jgi:GNAT superfamily N-acetyltransferase
MVRDRLPRSSPGGRFSTDALRASLKRQTSCMTTLRIAYLADYPEAIPVLAGWFAREWGDLDPQNTVEGFGARLLACANRDRLPICLLGLLDGEPVATATLKFREVEYLEAADFWVGSVYVREDVRGKGHGRAIVAAAEALAAAKNFTPLYLYTPRKEALYRRLGWQVAGQTTADGKQATVMTKPAEPWHAPDIAARRR